MRRKKGRAGRPEGPRKKRNACWGKKREEKGGGGWALRLVRSAEGGKDPDCLAINSDKEHEILEIRGGNRNWDLRKNLRKPKRDEGRCCKAAGDGEQRKTGQEDVASETKVHSVGGEKKNDEVCVKRGRRD